MAVKLMRRFSSHERALSTEKRVRSLAVEEGAPAPPQIQRVEATSSTPINVGELNASISKLTELLTGMAMKMVDPRTCLFRCYSCGEEGHMARQCDKGPAARYGRKKQGEEKSGSGTPQVKQKIPSG